MGNATWEEKIEKKCGKKEEEKPELVNGSKRPRQCQQRLRHDDRTDIVKTHICELIIHLAD